MVERGCEMGCHYHPDKETIGTCVNCGQFICAECKVVLGGDVYCNQCVTEPATRTAVSQSPNWFQRHLNWTWVFAYLIWIPLNASENIAPQIVGAIFLLFISGWVIKQKGRRLWWILLAPFFSPLWLKNKRVFAEGKIGEVIMPDVTTHCELTVDSDEAKSGTKRILIRKDKRLEVTIPPGVATGSVVKLTGALQITDGVCGDMFIHIKETGRWRVLKTPGFWSPVLCSFGVYSFLIPAINLFFFVGAIVLGSIQLKRQFSKLAVAGLIIGALSLIYFGVTVVQLELMPHSAAHIYDAQGFREIAGNRKPIELVNNPNAENPSWNELMAFIRADTTDSKPYIETFYWSYLCADYARDVHNNAEAAGIRAAWVGIDFEEGGPGHAINAFLTTDKGLVFVDCTGWDAIAYVKIGEPLGKIDLDLALSPEYSFYEEFRHIWPYAPMGVVKDMQIHWGS